MEGPPLPRKHSLDDGIIGAGTAYGGSLSSALLEPSGHDVMSMELAHHDIGGYLDPRSFGGGSIVYDEYSGQSSLYDMHSVSFTHDTQVENTQNGSTPMNTTVKFETLSDTAHNVTNTKVFDPARNVPTYPVKTADPSTCSQYAPVRTMIGTPLKPSHNSRRSSSRSAQKKETIDPKRVEDEVARNVSQILSATKQQRLAMEAQQRSGLLPATPPRVAYACPDCHKTVTSARNLQRHRQTCMARNGSHSGGSVSSTASAHLSSSSSFPNQLFSSNAVPEEHHYADWSRSSSYSAPHSVSSQDKMNEPAEQLGALDPNSISCRLEDACLQPLSLDVDEPRTHSSSGSTSSASTGTPTAQFTCDSCKKSVSSFRSLKRHHTTCKQYIAENGPPPDSEKKIRKRSDRRSISSTVSASRTHDSSLRIAQSLPLSIAHVVPDAVPSIYQSSVSSPLGLPSYTVVTVIQQAGQWPPLRRTTVCVDSQPVITSSCYCGASQSLTNNINPCLCQTSLSPSGGPNSSWCVVVHCQPKPPGNNNTCEDCNRQLCSASNLKRHRVTCKIVMQKQYSKTGSVTSPVHKPSQQWQSVEIPARDRLIIDRSYAAALAASQEAQQRNNNGYVLAQDPAVAEKPWITVGEHLRAQHVQQKILEAANQRPVEQITAPQEQATREQTVNYVEGRNSIDQINFSEMDEHIAYGLGETTDDSELDEFEDIDLEAFDDDLIREEEERAKESANDKRFREEDRSSTPVPIDNIQLLSVKMDKPLEVKSETAPRAVPSITQPITPLESIITTQPLSSDRLTATYAKARYDHERHSSDAIHSSVPATFTNTGFTSPVPPPAKQICASSEFQCPECLKTYSCRKNVKRHRMAVHKLTAEQVARNPGPMLSINGSEPPVSSPNRTAPSRNITDFKSDPLNTASIQHSPQIRYHAKSTITSQHAHWDSHTWRRSREYVDDEESAETARIAAELKRSAEEEYYQMAEIEGKKPRTELAEADTTFHEETDSTGHHPISSSPRPVNLMSPGRSNSSVVHPASATVSRNSLPSIASWIDQKPLSVNVSASPHSVHNSPIGRLHKRPPHVCSDCNRVLSSDYSLRRHRMTCVEARGSTVQTPSPVLSDGMMNQLQGPMTSSDPMLTHASSLTHTPSSAAGHSSTHFDTRSEEDWYRKGREEVPDSTTSQRLDRSTSPGLMSGSPDAGPPQFGGLQYTRKRANSGGSYGETSKQNKHLCQSVSASLPCKDVAGEMTMLSTEWYAEKYWTAKMFRHV
uniref:C2H2-type domain-containing protein n=1 Tax=Heterorhabditis bacteriophora TaxID=37862 RepID=A0A1I7XU59_HETBA